jgi:hypothetical protein
MAEAVDPGKITVQRCDAELPENVALSIHRIWLQMLSDVRQERRAPGTVYLHGTTEIFTAVDANGQRQTGRRPHEVRKHGNVENFVRVAFLLVKYCDPPPDGRDKVLVDIRRTLKEFEVKSVR